MLRHGTGRWSVTGDGPSRNSQACAHGVDRRHAAGEMLEAQCALADEATRVRRRRGSHASARPARAASQIPCTRNRPRIDSWSSSSALRGSALNGDRLHVQADWTCSGPADRPARSARRACPRARRTALGRARRSGSRPVLRPRRRRAAPTPRRGRSHRRRARARCALRAGTAAPRSAPARRCCRRGSRRRRRRSAC